MSEWPKQVRVDWLDSGMHLDHGWAKAEKYITGIDRERLMVTTVGMLMHEDDEVVVVGLSYDHAHQSWYGAQVILKSAICYRAPVL